MLYRHWGLVVSVEARNAIEAVLLLINTNMVHICGTKLNPLYLLDTMTKCVAAISNLSNKHLEMRRMIQEREKETRSMIERITNMNSDGDDYDMRDRAESEVKFTEKINRMHAECIPIEEEILNYARELKKYKVIEFSNNIERNDTLGDRPDE